MTCRTPISVLKDIRVPTSVLVAALLVAALLTGCDGSLTATGENTFGMDGGTGRRDAGTSGQDASPGGQDAGPGTHDAGNGDAGNGDAGAPIETDIRNYIFGHSLLNHAPIGATLTNVPIWLHELSQAAGYQYTMSGQFGFASTHADNLPPDAQWGIPGVTSAWDDAQPFGTADFNAVLLTEANFVQYFPPTETDGPGLSSVDNTVTVFDWVEDAEPGVRYIIYENWPDMAPYTNADFTSSFPTHAELNDYYNFTRGDFHQWWIDYHDALMARRPGMRIHMVPAGPVLASLLTGVLSDVPASVLYEDDAPHGRPTLYFLAAIATYISLYGVEPPAGYAVPASIDSRVRDRYDQIVVEVAAELEAFRTPGGQSRVF